MKKVYFNLLAALHASVRCCGEDFRPFDTTLLFVRILAIASMSRAGPKARQAGAKATCRDSPIRFLWWRWGRRLMVERARR